MFLRDFITPQAQEWAGRIRRHIAYHLIHTTAKEIAMVELDRAMREPSMFMKHLNQRTRRKRARRFQGSAKFLNN